MKDYLKIKNAIEKAVSENLAELIALNDDLADHPEVSAEEFETSKKIVNLLRNHGFEVEYPVAGLGKGFDTSFKAVYGPDNHKYKVAILTEYDALPEVGHACGHCVSGSISILAGLACAGIQDELDCDIHVVGTPNEEVDGAKCTMVKTGFFDKYDMAMMIHLYDGNLPYCTLLALDSYMFEFHGRPAHGALAPWEGRNALNGAQLMMHAVDMMRQHVTPDVRMHAVYRNGGAAPNIVPEEASIELYVRALDRKYLNTLVEWVYDIAEGCAMATKTTVTHYPTSQPYDNLVNNAPGLEVLAEVYKECGVEYNGDPDIIFGSSDAGNVSFVCPTFHPTLQIVEPGTPIHTREFEAAVKTETAHKAIETGAKIIGLQIAKIFSDEQKIKAMKDDFEANK